MESGGPIRRGLTEIDRLTTTNATRWSIHPLKSEPVTRTALLILILLIVGMVFTLAYDVFTGIFCGGILVGAVSRYLLPTRYEAGPEGLVVSHIGRTHRYRWKSFARVDRHGDGFFFSPNETPSRLDTFRGIFVRLPNSEDSEAVRSAIEGFAADNTL